MRATMKIERHLTSFASYLIGEDASKILATINGVSVVRIDAQHIDRATLSYECSEHGANLDQIDQLLGAKGMRRV